MRLTPKQFTYKKIEGLNFPIGLQAGFIAQEVREIFPELVNGGGLPIPNRSQGPDSLGTSESVIHEYLTLNYIGLFPYVVKAIQEQQRLIDEQSKLIAALIRNEPATVLPVSVPFIRSLYPNPATDLLTIQIANNLGDAVIAVYDSDGKIFNTLYLDTQSTDLSLESFKNGIYFISLSVGGVVFDVKRFMVSK